MLFFELLLTERGSGSSQGNPSRRSGINCSSPRQAGSLHRALRFAVHLSALACRGTTEQPLASSGADSQTCVLALRTSQHPASRSSWLRSSPLLPVCIRRELVELIRNPDNSQFC